MLKKILLINIVLIFILAQNAMASSITFLVNDKPIIFSVSPVAVKDRILVPCRDIFGALGAAVAWDDATQTVTARKGTDEIKFAINGLAYKNGRAINLAAPARIIQGSAMVPLRFAAEELDYEVSWNGTSGTVAISAISGNPIQPPPDTYSNDQKVQYYLSAMGFPTEAGNASQNEVLTTSKAILFQYKMGLKITGKFDMDTIAELERSAQKGWTYDSIMNREGQKLMLLSKNPEINGKLNTADMVVMPAPYGQKGLLPAYTAVGWAKLVQAAAKDPGNDMSAFMLISDIGGYRSYDQQVELYKESGPATAALPSRSRHGFGLAIDFNFSDPQTGRAVSHELKWMEKNASAFGFTPDTTPNDSRPWTSYFPDGSLNYWETWHWNYPSSTKYQ
ncbi:MAG TPA: stalk domain-containing protein [Syntrophomonadaceae bacterium]|nr:stalk domain-containing protein [Syntrophomonadaceae bacterium]